MRDQETVANREREQESQVRHCGDSGWGGGGG